MTTPYSIPKRYMVMIKKTMELTTINKVKMANGLRALSGMLSFFMIKINANANDAISIINNESIFMVKVVSISTYHYK